MVTYSLEELLSTASSKFGIAAKRIFTPQGGEIDDIKLLRLFIYLFTYYKSTSMNTSNLKVFILPRVAELFIHKEKQRGCPLLGANI